jgi:hypothetical protein
VKGGQVEEEEDDSKGRMLTLKSISRTAIK